MNTVETVFEQAFVTVSDKLLDIQMHKKEMSPDYTVEEPVCRVMIHTTGYIQLEITCVFSQELLQQIVSRMYGGGMPPDEETPLYIKEYVNIACGRGISQLNNQLGKASRLSVPYYQQEIMHLEGAWKQMHVIFETEYGAMQVILRCSEEVRLSKEGLQNGKD